MKKLSQSFQYKFIGSADFVGISKTEKPIGSAFLFFKRGGDPNVAEAVLTDEKINLTGGMCNVLQ